MKNTQLGFTIIEVILFTAISGLFLIIASTTLSGRNQEVQFTDSMRSLESDLTNVYQQTVNGVLNTSQGCRNTGSSYTFGSPSISDGSCIFLGFIVEFADYGASNPTNPELNQANVISVYGKRDIEGCSNPSEPLWCADPTINSAQPKRLITIPWGVEISKSSDNSLAFGFFRNPESAGVIPVAFNNRTRNYTNRAFYRASSPQTNIGSEFGNHYCFANRDGDKYAAIDVGSSLRQTAIDVTFLDARCL